jgi:hypothetical protein
MTWIRARPAALGRDVAVRHSPRGAGAAGEAEPFTPIYVPRYPVRT